jgi:hypothetical protein
MADQEMTSSGSPSPPDNERRIITQISMNIAFTQIASYPVVLDGGKMYQDILNTSGRPPVIIPVIASLGGIHATIDSAEIVPGGYRTGIFGNGALLSRGAIIIQYTGAYPCPAPLSLLLKNFRYI